MKILHVYKDYFPNSYGGVENFINILAKEQSKQNKVTILSCSKKNKIFEYENYKIFSFKKNFTIFSCPFSFSLLIHFLKTYRKYDIINFHAPWPFIEIIALFIKKKYIVTYHSDIIKQKKILLIYSYFLKKFLNKSFQIISTSKKYFLSSHYLKNLKNIKIIPLGISEDSIVLNKLESDKIQLPTKYFVFIGKNRHYKGVQYLFEAFKNTDMKCLIIGEGYKKYSKDENIKKNFTFIKSIDEKEKLKIISNSCGLLLPSINRAEAFGYVFLEAGINRKPSITCELNTGTSCVVKHNYSGLVVEKKNSYELSKACKKIFYDDSFSNFLGENAYKRVREKFLISTVNLKYYTLYKKLLND